MAFSFCRKTGHLQIHKVLLIDQQDLTWVCKIRSRLCGGSNEKIQSENDNDSLHIDIRLVLPQVVPGRVFITSVDIGHMPSIY